MKFEVTPLPLLKKGPDGLIQYIEVTLPEEINGNILLKIVRDKCAWEFKFDSGGTKEIFLPEVKEEVNADFIFRFAGEEIKEQVLFKPVRKWTVYLILHSHTDLGFTAPVSEVAQIHNINTDKAIEFCNDTKGLPEGSKFKWTCEVTWQVQNYIGDRKPDQVEKLMTLVRNKDIEIAALYSGHLTELMGHEEAIRSFYYAAKLRREYNVSIDTAMLCDVPGCTKGFVQIMAKAGINNFILADNNFIAPFLSRTDLPRPFYWKGDDNTKVLAWYTDHPFYAYIEGKNYGLAESYEETRKKLPAKLIELENSGYRFDDFQLQYAFDNFEIEFLPAEVVKEWNEKWDYPKIRLSTAGEFLNNLRGKHDKQIPLREGDWTNWWDGIVTGYPYETSQSMAVHSLLPAVESIASILKMTNPEFIYPARAIEHAYDNILAFDEHSGSGMVWEPKSDEEQVKALKEGYGFIEDAFNDTIKLEKELLSNFGSLIKCDDGSIIVYNSLGWQRSGMVKTDVDISGDYFLIDNMTGEKVIAFCDNGKIIFYANDIPALGYKTYKIKKAESPGNREKIITGKDHSIQFGNDYWDIVVDENSGSIKSLFNKKIKSEIAGERFNSIQLYKPKPFHFEMGKFIPELYNGVEVPGDIIPLKGDSRYGIKVSEDATGRIICIVSHYLDNQKWLDQKIILHKEFIEFENCIDGKLIRDKNFLSKNLSEQGILYCCFSVRPPNCRMRYEAPCSVIEPAKEQFAGTCKDYTSVQSWFQLFNDEININFSSLDAPLIDFGDIALMKYRNDYPEYVENFYVRAVSLSDLNGRAKSPYNTNVPLIFRFALSANPANEKFVEGEALPSKVPAYKLGHEFHSPLQSVYIGKNATGVLPEKQYSFIKISELYIQIMTFKQAEDGNGMILRLRELLGIKRDIVVILSINGIKKIFKSSITEEIIEEIPFSAKEIRLSINPYSIETLRMNF